MFKLIRFLTYFIAFMNSKKSYPIVHRTFTKKISTYFYPHIIEPQHLRSLARTQPKQTRKLNRRIREVQLVPECPKLL